MINARDVLGMIVTTDPDVVHLVSKLLIVVSLFQLFDGLQTCIAAIFRGMGRQSKVAMLNLLGFWLVGLPVGAALTFSAHVGLIGLWWGLAAGLCGTSMFGFFQVLRVDWNKEVQDAQNRASQEAKEFELATTKSKIPVAVTATAAAVEVAMESSVDEENLELEANQKKKKSKKETVRTHLIDSVSE
jgi:O-antigen/teichoic acid export membrane protein